MTFDRKIGDVDVTAQTRRGFGGGEGFKREGRKKSDGCEICFSPRGARAGREAGLAWYVRIFGLCRAGS